MTGNTNLPKTNPGVEGQWQQGKEKVGCSRGKEKGCFFFLVLVPAK